MPSYVANVIVQFDADHDEQAWQVLDFLIDVAGERMRKTCPDRDVVLSENGKPQREETDDQDTVAAVDRGGTDPPDDQLGGATAA